MRDERRLAQPGRRGAHRPGAGARRRAISVRRAFGSRVPCDTADGPHGETIELASLHHGDSPLTHAGTCRYITLTEAEAPAYRPDHRADLDIIHCGRIM